MNWIETLFNASPESFREGHLVFLGRLSPQILFPALLILCTLVWLSYRSVRQRSPAGAWRAVLTLRLLLIAVLVLVLAIPALRTMRSREDVYTVVLVDTSRSMSIADVAVQDGSISRMEAARQLLLGEKTNNPGLIEALKQSSKILLYAFDEQTRRISAAAELTPDGNFTNIFRGVRDMETEVRGLPLAGVILVTDGCRNDGGSSDDAAALLKARGIPLFPIGLGNPNPPKDYEIVRVVAPRRVRRHSEVEIAITVRHTGFHAPFEVAVRRGESVVATALITPDSESDLATVRLFFTPDHEETATYTVAVAAAQGEASPDNNSREYILEIQDDRLPVLYVEGSPRMEYRFLRHALHGDRDFRLVGLLRLGDTRFYVQGANANEAFLQNGFPATKEQLFAFQAIILGDIEASYFSPEQLAMLEEFVRLRGGGLLMLGGVNSFGLGKYAGTPVARMLPVEVTPNDGPYSEEQYKARVVQGIGVHPVMRLSLDPESNRTLWNQAPNLIGLTPVGLVKTGALPLLTREGDDEPVLAVNNYGFGRVAAFTSGGSWYWRVSVPSENEFYEKFWKQLVRWLAIGAKERLTIEAGASIYAPGKPVMIRATALAKDLQPVNDAEITATVTDPAGNEQGLPLEWILSEEGAYQAQYIPREEGDYRISATAEGWDTVEGFFRVSAPNEEAADAGLKEQSLRAMAEATGGRYFSFGEANELPAALDEKLRSARFSGMRPVDRELWDTPLWFALVFGLMVSEWIVRRKSGLA